MAGHPGPRFALPLEAVEQAGPTAAVQVFAERLREQVGARSTSFLITDFSARRLVRLTSSREPGEETGSIPLDDETLPYERVVVEQRARVIAEDGCSRVLAPVTARGDAMGVLDVVLPGTPDGATVETVASAAHALAYVVTSERRHTDLYQWGQRSRPVSLAAEIQRQLLPGAFTCEAGQFTLAGWLEPANAVGGDTFDFSLDEERLYLSLTDAMGHDVDAALLATLTVGSLRNGRRASHGLARIAQTASEAIDEYRDGFGFSTGLLMDVELSTGAVEVVDAGHPNPLLVRDGTVVRIELEPDCPMGIAPETGYRVQRLQLEPGDMLVLLTDGMLERNAQDVDLPALLVEHRDAHPRQLMQILTTAVQEASDGHGLTDDATALCVRWHGPGGGRTASGGANGGPTGRR